jgi:PIN domain nuclease of toxin-antitoxin system
LALTRPLPDFFADYVEGNGFLVLPVERAHLLAVHALPFHHRDPLDRLLIAQCITENLTFLSADATMDAYGVTRLW